ncbi:DNA polymerase III subunit epsilon [Rhodovulum sulfidophilum]|uniref:DNA polymerase III subunit epsilon n=1 Tax=Rhodovulum visakhapatnamense TaxID=364297 RepID=A0ABS1RAU0_9RHOB|nr:DNA polymerase III subunit epsilon [Rhodovulum visakhapatnamense]MBL3568258.1 DNA polymerase III subunit epsilon [Rhodovulum visakhapatnamense]MBL3576604.1 DNA polymerase III subunit epsilon [Rhodovulum visakhapatnamense]OLS43208.1 DNA polymerase III subunit epsilon [Rhodovulum sulfidophilum]
MREIVLDTETTGFEPETGDRIVEIGAVVLWNHLPTGETFHVYINPGRDMPDEAFGVHGIGPDILANPRPAKPGEVTLRDKPPFSEVGRKFLDFVQDSKLVIHNASFDMKFLNAELGWLGLPKLPMSQALDTLAMARKKFPGSPATLDALCRRFGIDNTMREKHGALLDSEILAEVYLELIGGRQPDFMLATRSRATGGGSEGDAAAWRPRPRPIPLPPRLTEDEAAAHRAFVQAMGDGALWKNYD